MRRRLFRLVALLFVALLVVTSCDDSSEGEASEPSSRPTSSSTTTPGGSPSPETTVTGSVLRVAVQEPAVLDPMRVQDPASVLIVRQLFESLTRWDQEQKEVVPAAAESWRTRDGAKTFVFSLREGMTFHDGTPVTSQDFAVAFDRIAQRANAADVAYTLELVKGFDDVNQFGTADHLEGITTPDDKTLVIKLSTPYQDFPAVMTHPALVPIPPGALQNIDAFLTEPVGNGPFQMAAPWSSGSAIELLAFDGFYEPTEIAGIRFIPFPDAAVSWLQFLDDDIDVAEVPSSEVESAGEEFGDDGFQPLLAAYYFGINLDSKGFSDRGLRLAVNRAIDREAIADDIYKGTMAPPRGIVPEGMPGFGADICKATCEYSPSSARRSIKKLPKGDRTVTIDFTKGDPHGAVARSIQKDLKAVGLDVKIQGHGFNKYLELLRAEKSSLYRLGWIAEYPSPDVFLSPLFGSGSPDNHSSFASKKVDDLLDRARRAGTELKQLFLYRRAEKEILKEVPIVPIGTFASFWAARPEVSGLRFDVMGGFDAAAASIDVPGEDDEE